MMNVNKPFGKWAISYAEIKVAYHTSRSIAAICPVFQIGKKPALVKPIGKPMIDTGMATSGTMSTSARAKSSG
jgi:hypothetical protein